MRLSRFVIIATESLLTRPPSSSIRRLGTTSERPVYLGVSPELQSAAEQHVAIATQMQHMSQEVEHHTRVSNTLQSSTQDHSRSVSSDSLVSYAVFAQVSHTLNRENSHPICFTGFPTLCLEEAA